MKTTLLSVFTLISFVAFGQTTKTEREGEPDIYNVEDDDKEMNEAIKKSRQTFSEFMEAFKNQKSNQTGFSVKMPFATKDGSEHIWLIDIESKDGKLFGTVDNVPEDVKSVKLGDKVEIDGNKISDWFYIEDNKLIGGLTIRVLRNRMSASDRKQFDRSFGVKFN